MQILKGPADYQVLQRSEGDVAHITCFGTCRSESGMLSARLVRQDDPTAVVRQWSNPGQVKDRKWVATLDGIPVGGEYRLELTILVRAASPQIVEQAGVEHLLVGDLWILAGQSNMEGVGNLPGSAQPSSLVHNFDMSDAWMVAEEPLHRLPLSVDPVHSSAGPRSPAKGAGLGLSFALEMVKHTGIPIGLIPCAQGGTSMSQWSPNRRDEGGKSLYGAMYRRFLQVGGRVRGLLWYQGESDATEAASNQFADRFRDFVNAVRHDLNSPELPVLYVQIGRVISRGDIGAVCRWNQIQEAQRLLEDELSPAAMVASIDLELDDFIHIGTRGLACLGIRLANVTRSRLFCERELKRGPRLERVQLSSGKDALEVTFTGVNGRIVSAGRPAGFSLTDQQENELPILFAVRLEREKPDRVFLLLTEPLPKGARLYYGRGFDPYCNLQDELGMAAPVFGPILCN